MDNAHSTVGRRRRFIQPMLRQEHSMCASFEVSVDTRNLVRGVASFNNLLDQVMLAFTERPATARYGATHHSLTDLSHSRGYPDRVANVALFVFVVRHELSRVVPQKMVLGNSPRAIYRHRHGLLHLCGNAFRCLEVCIKPDSLRCLRQLP